MTTLLAIPPRPRRPIAAPPAEVRPGADIAEGFPRSPGATVKRTSSPVEDLRQAVHSGLSGEFICAAPKVEIHLFLQRGRVAWATDSAHPYEFSKELMVRASIDAQVFREVLESCRRDRLPLGETLITWKLASLEDVRAALTHQLRIAVASLIACDKATTVFLERPAFAMYDERLTFDLAQVLGEQAVAAPARVVAPAVPTAAAPAAAAAPEDSLEGSARELLGAIKGATRVEVIEADRPIEMAGEPGAPRVSARFAAVALEGGADFVALRAPGGSLLGAKLVGSQRQMWATLRPDATIGAAVVALYTAGVLARLTRARRGQDLVRWRSGSVEVEAQLGDPFAFGRDVLAVVVLRGDELVFASGHTLGEEEAVALARRRRAILSVAPHEGAPGDAAGARTVVTGEERVWCFGAETPGASVGSTVWVLTRRDGAQGIGFACLAALSRAMGCAADGAAVARG
jgi:hypothetical protein